MPKPNRTTSGKQANRANLGQPVTGRMGRSGERVTTSASHSMKPTADQVLALQLDTGADQQLRVLSASTTRERQSPVSNKQGIESSCPISSCVPAIGVLVVQSAGT